MKPYQLPQRIIDLANEYDESKHPRDDDGKWTSTGVGSGGGGKAIKGLEYKDSQGQSNSVEHVYTKMLKSGRAVMARNTPRAEKARILNSLMNDTRKERGDFAEDLFGSASDDDKTRHRRAGRATLKALHVAAIAGGLKFNRATHRYE